VSTSDPVPGGAIPGDPTDVLDLPSAGAKVIRGSALRMLAFVGGVALSVVAAAVMTRHLGVVDFGHYVTVLALISVVAGLSEAGMSNIGIREYATRLVHEREPLMRNLLGMRVALSVVGVGAATAFTAVAYEDVLIAGTAIAGVGLILTAAQQTIGVPLAASLRFGWLSALELGRQAALTGLIVVFAAAGAGLLAFLAAPIPVSVLLLVATVVLVRGLMPLTPSFDLGEWRRILGLTFAYTAASAVGTIYVHTAVVTTSLVANEVETGEFGAAFRVFTILTAIPLLLVTTVFPVLARRARGERKRLAYVVSRVTETALIVGAWMALMTVAGAGLGIQIIGGDEFEGSVRVLELMGLAILAAFLAVAWGFSLLSLHRHRIVLTANALAFALSVTMTLALVPEFGAEGAAAATLIGESALALTFAGALFVRERLPFPGRALPPVLLASALAVPFAVLSQLPDLVRLAGVTGVFFAVAALLGAIPQEVRDTLGSLGKRSA
jgi:O-antigen/teichoic acid export membrane protein